MTFGIRDFPCIVVGLRSYPRIRPHDLAIQIDITGALLLCEGPDPGEVACGGGLVKGGKQCVDFVGRKSGVILGLFQGPKKRDRRHGDLPSGAMKSSWENAISAKCAFPAPVGEGNY